MTARWDELTRFYALLHELERTAGARRLSDCSGRMVRPSRGVYFFREDGENRAGAGPRIVRVGTHALKPASKSSLWQRLSQHRGTGSGAGNHRGSIFRLLVGEALVKRDALSSPTWGVGSSAVARIRAGERALEERVSVVIGAMSVLWLEIDDEPGPESLRGYVERNSIALLSNYGKPTLDPPSASWLGRSSGRERVRRSGLWNQNHVDASFDPAFLGRLEALVKSRRATR